MKVTRRKTNALAAGLAALALVSAPAVVLAGPWEGHRGPMAGGPADRVERLAARLDLTDEQRVQVEQLFARHREEMAPLMERMRDARATIHERVHADTFDEAAIRAAAANLATIEGDLAVARASHRQQLREVLTAEQLDRLDEMHARRRGHHRWHGFGPGPGPGLR